MYCEQGGTAVSEASVVVSGCFLAQKRGRDGCACAKHKIFTYFELLGKTEKQKFRIQGQQGFSGSSPEVDQTSRKRSAENSPQTLLVDSFQKLPELVVPTAIVCRFASRTMLKNRRRLYCMHFSAQPDQSAGDTKVRRSHSDGYGGTWKEIDGYQVAGRCVAK